MAEKDSGGNYEAGAIGELRKKANVRMGDNDPDSYRERIVANYELRSWRCRRIIR